MNKARNPKKAMGWLLFIAILVSLLAFSTGSVLAGNIIANPGFEAGSLSSWTGFGTVAAASGGYSGSYQCSHSGLSGIEQTVTGLSTNTTYIMTSYIRTTTSNTIYAGVKNYGGNQITASTTGASWYKATVQFTIGPSNTTATIFTYLDGGTGYADAFTLYTAASPTITVTSPNGSESWGGTHNITWTTTGNWTDRKVVLEFSLDNTVWYPIKIDIDPDVGTYSWDTRAVTNLFGDDIATGRIRARADNNACSDTSNASFTVNNYGTAAAAITLTSPANNETVSGVKNITWSASGNWSGKTVNIYYTPDGTNWNSIATGLNPLDGTYAWETREYTNATWPQFLVCDETFSVASTPVSIVVGNSTASIVLKNPVQNERWSGTEKITWKTYGSWTGKTVSIDYSSNGGANWTNLATGLTPSTGYYSWNTAAVSDGTTYQVRVKDNTGTITFTSGNMTILNAKNNTRSYTMGFTTFPYDLTVQSETIKKQYLKNHGDMVVIWEDGSLPWVEAGNRTTFSQSFRDHWQGQLDNIGNSTSKIFYSINPGRSGALSKYWGTSENMELPSPWSTYALDDQRVIDAYTYIVEQVISFFNPTYVAISFEAEGFFKDASLSDWNAFMRLNKAVYDNIKAAHPSITVLGTMTGALVHNPKYEMLMAGYFNYSDCWGFSTYPYGWGDDFTIDYTTTGTEYPSNFYDDFVDEAAKYGKKIAIGESGYIHDNLDINDWSMHYISSEALQNYHINRILKDCNEGDALFVNNWSSLDLDQLWSASNEGVVKNQFAIWRDIGLRQYDNPGWTIFSAEATWDGWLSKRDRTTGDTTAPGNVTGFSATNNQVGQVSLLWTKPADADSVKILRKTGSYSTNNTDGEVIYMGVDTSFTDITAVTGTTYYYSAWARDASFNWSDGTAAGAKATGAATTDTTAPENISNFTASNDQAGIRLTWTNPTANDYAGVKIMRKTGSYSTSNTDGTQVYYGTGTHCQFTDTTVTAGTTYYYSAWARDEDGNWSDGTVIGAKGSGVGGTELFSDQFETDFSKWTDGGTTDWDRSTKWMSAGYYSAHATSGRTYLTSDNINTAGVTKITVHFWYRAGSISDSDNLYLQFYNGTTYNNIGEIGITGTQYGWVLYEYTTTDAQYLNKSNFRIRIDGSTLAAGKDIWIDQVSVAKF